MTLPIETQTFVVTVSASLMPHMTEHELHNEVLRLAVDKERQRGMGFLEVEVREVAGANVKEWVR